MFVFRTTISIIMLSFIVMFAAGCGEGTSTAPEDKPDSSLTETYWKLTKLNGVEVVAPKGQREAHLILRAQDNRVVGSGGCNRIMGGYELNGETLTFSQMAGTRMMCPNMDDEQHFLQTLESVNRYKINGETMQMFQDDKLLLEFKAVYLQ